MSKKDKKVLEDIHKLLATHIIEDKKVFYNDNEIISGINEYLNTLKNEEKSLKQTQNWY